MNAHSKSVYPMNGNDGFPISGLRMKSNARMSHATTAAMRSCHPRTQSDRREDAERQQRDDEWPRVGKERDDRRMRQHAARREQLCAVRGPERASSSAQKLEEML